MSYLTLNAERKLWWQASWVRRHGQDVNADFWPSALVRLPPLYLRGRKDKVL